MATSAGTVWLIAPSEGAWRSGGDGRTELGCAARTGGSGNARGGCTAHAAISSLVRKSTVLDADECLLLRAGSGIMGGGELGRDEGESFGLAAREFLRERKIEDALLRSVGRTDEDDPEPNAGPFGCVGSGGSVCARVCCPISVLIGAPEAKFLSDNFLRRRRPHVSGACCSVDECTELASEP